MGVAGIDHVKFSFTDMLPTTTCMSNLEVQTKKPAGNARGGLE